MSRGEIDAYTEFVKIYGAKGLAWIKVNDAGKGRDGLQSPIVKNLHDAEIAEIIARTGACNGDLIFFGADKAKVVLAIKRSMNPGFAGIENELYFADNTLMLFGDAKGVIGDVVKNLSGQTGIH